MYALVVENPGHFSYRDEGGILHRCQFPLFLIGQAWRAGCDFEALADGFGPGNGTMGGDWSGIRDSTDQAVAKMLCRALEFLFLEEHP